MVRWENIGTYISRKYTCKYCGNLVATQKGYVDAESPNQARLIRICPHCGNATYFKGTMQFPAPSYGDKVQYLPEDINALYEEARDCTGANAFTASVLACRKILMHIAVDKGDKPGKTYVEYIEYLSNKGYVPPNGKEWVDQIRTKGNEANHEIVKMEQKDAENLLTFLAGLLRFIYEFPGRIPSKSPEDTKES